MGGHKYQSAVMCSVMLGMCSSFSAMGGDGVIVLQREVPHRVAYREGAPARPSTVDVSPDDKVQQMVSGQGTSLNSTELLGDSDFAAITTGTPQTQGVITHATNSLGLTDIRTASQPLHGAASPAGPVQSVVPMVTGAVGPAVGAATGQVGAAVTGVTGALNGLTGSIMRTGGQ